MDPDWRTDRVEGGGPLTENPFDDPDFVRVWNASTALRAVATAADDSSYGPAFRGLEQAAAAATDRWLATSPDNIGAVFEWMAHRDVIENILGTALVLGQVRLSAIASAAIKLASLVNSETLSKLPWTKTKRPELLQFGAAAPIGSVSVVTAIEGLANYYKHRDGWPADWTKMTSQQKPTADIVAALGIGPAHDDVWVEPDHLARVVAAMGWSATDLSGMETSINEWGAKVLAAFDALLPGLREPASPSVEQSSER